MRMKLIGMACGLVIASPATAVTGLGDPAAALQAMRELNLIVLNNLQAQGQEVEGKTFVGGNVTGNGTNFGIGNTQQGSSPSSRATLSVVGGMNQQNSQLNNGSNGGVGRVGTPASVVVGGDVKGMNFNAQNGTMQVGGNLQNFNGSSGGAYQVGGSTSGNINANGSTITTGLGTAFASSVVAGLVAERDSLSANLNGLSQTLAGMTLADNPSSVLVGSQGPVFNAVAGDNGFALFTIDANLLSMGQINFSFLGDPMPIVVNVLGQTVNWNANPVGAYNASLNPWLIWNFVDATTINVDRMVHGSMLAPLATITNSTAIEGTIVALNMNMRGEVHLGSYAGGSDWLLPEPIPEPASWAMLITGFGLVGAVMRRRRMVVA
ncbi:collagen-binding domain-containing protein [Polymorphobacter sp.]|uniref:collagen-binding domain-containing protein n=1 Tax=Polymorphobacter sp. TaxID=1909290 RepID=UPI003F713C8B